MYMWICIKNVYAPIKKTPHMSINCQIHSQSLSFCTGCTSTADLWKKERTSCESNDHTWIKFYRFLHVSSGVPINSDPVGLILRYKLQLQLYMEKCSWQTLALHWRWSGHLGWSIHNLGQLALPLLCSIQECQWSSCRKQQITIL